MLRVDQPRPPSGTVPSSHWPERGMARWHVRTSRVRKCEGNGRVDNRSGVEVNVRGVAPYRVGHDDGPMPPDSRQRDLSACARGTGGRCGVATRTAPPGRPRGSPARARRVPHPGERAGVRRPQQRLRPDRTQLPAAGPPIGGHRRVGGPNRAQEPFAPLNRLRDGPEPRTRTVRAPWSGRCPRCCRACGILCRAADAGDLKRSRCPRVLATVTTPTGL